MRKFARVLTPIVLIAAFLTTACSEPAPLGPSAQVTQESCDSTCPNIQ